MFSFCLIVHRRPKQSKFLALQAFALTSLPKGVEARAAKAVTTALVAGATAVRATAPTAFATPAMGVAARHGLRGVA